MRLGFAAALAASLLGSGAARAGSDSPAGTWMTEEGDSRIRVSPCGKAYCATVVWAKTVSSDEHNPDPSLRRRSIVGLPLTQDMVADRKGGWSGSIYNPDDGKTYRASMKFKSADSLEVSGCVLAGLLCGSDTWARQSEETASAQTIR